MATYVMLGNYTQDAIGKISAARTEVGLGIIADNGGEAKAGYALLGQYDILLVVDFPSNEQAMKASVALAKALGIAFTTAPAVSIEDFDKLVG